MSVEEFFGLTPPKCTCVEREHNYAFNEHPGVRCKKHPHCIFEHAQYNAAIKAWIFPKANTFELGGAIKTNGMIAFRVRCTGCGNTSWELKKTDFAALMERGILYTWTRDAYAHADTNVCQVKGCGRTDVSFHHFAPRNVFGEEADSYPVLPLCQDHHTGPGGWHDRMNGYQWKAKGIAPQPKPAAQENLEPWHGRAVNSQ